MNRKNLKLGGKRLIAVLCTLVLLFGMLNGLTIKAAGEVNATLSYDGFADQPNVGTGRWLIYAALDTAMTADITSTTQYMTWAFASMNDSTEEFSMDVYATSTSRIFYTMAYSKLGVTAPSELAVGTTVTIKARTMSGYLIPNNDFTIYWTGDSWKELRELPLSTISSQQQAVLTTTNTELQTLFDSRGTTTDMPLTGVGDSCVYLNGNATTKTKVNYSQWGLYLDASSIKGSNYAVGDEIWIKGIFSQTVNSNVYYKMDEGFVCIATSGTNGATWAYKSSLSMKSNNDTTLYLTDTQGLAYNSSAYNVFNGTGATVTYNGTAVTRYSASSGNYLYYDSSNDALRVYIPEYYDGNGTQVATAFKEGDVVYFGGTFSCNGKNINYGDNWFILQSDGTWLHTTEEPETETSFTITSGSYSYQDWSNLNRWAMTFTTSESLGTPEALTWLGNYKIIVDGSEQTVSFYNTTDGKLQLFVGQSILPQIPTAGTRVTIPAQSIGEEYVLTEDYSIIYDGGWKTYTAYVDTTLSVHTTWGSQNLQATLYPNEAEATAATLMLNSGTYFTQVSEDAGIWYNGEKLASTSGLKTTVNVDGGWVRYHVVLSDYNLTVSAHDIITIKGLFKNDSVYLNFSEINLKYNGSSWGVVSYGYEDLTIVYLDELLYQNAQNTDTLQRWQFKMQPSVSLETASASWGTDYAGYQDSLSVKIYHEDTPETVTTTSSYALHAQYNGADGYFGFIVNFTELPLDADGYVMVIEPGIFRSSNYTYKLNQAFTIKNIGGAWEVVLDRPDATGIDGDANGDGQVNSIDIVREMRELAGVAGKGGTEICTEDAFLNGKKAMLRKVDLISLYEIILRDGTASDTPFYLEDDEIMLAAYEGPRKGNSTDYSYDGSTLSSQSVTKSYLNATEFKRFADAGLNTVYVQADSSFDSMALMGANAGMLQNLNTYMELAAEVDVDVIAYSYYLDNFLRGKSITDWSGNSLELTTDNLKTELTELWEGHANAKGMRKYENFKGIMMSDELNYNDSFANYTSAIDVMENIHSDFEYYNSQYRMDASSTTTGYVSYTTDAAERFAALANAYGTAAGNFTYDHYPLRTSNGNASTAYVDGSWLYNLQLSAQNGKANGYLTGITVQSCGQERGVISSYYRNPEARADIGFQVYTALAYGMKSVTYYTYWEHHAQYDEALSQEKYTMAMVEYPADPEAENAEGVETPIYNAVKTVNNEINKFDHVFMEYDWEGTIALNINNNNSLYDGLASYSDDRISDYSSTNDALIGCTRDNNQGYDGFWLVNAMDPTASGTNTITVKFNDATRLMIYDPTAEGFDGSAKIVEYDATNGYTAELGVGEGQFVIPLK